MRLRRRRACRSGTQICDGFSFGPCQGAVGPSAEVDDGRDHDCDGLIGCDNPDLGSLGARFVGQSVPVEMTTGASGQATVTMENTGCTTWSATGFALGAVNPIDNAIWGRSRVPLLASVAPGETETIPISFSAPGTAGTYDFQWRLVQGGAWFGAPTDNVRIRVEAPGVCDINATPVGSIDSIECECNPGYEGDGFTCADIDECQELICDVNATCANLPGSFSCRCNPGWVGDGRECVAEDPGVDDPGVEDPGDDDLGADPSDPGAVRADGMVGGCAAVPGRIGLLVLVPILWRRRR